jgi:hypothetical protein
MDLNWQHQEVQLVVAVGHRTVAVVEALLVALVHFLKLWDQRELLDQPAEVEVLELEHCEDLWEPPMLQHEGPLLVL